jgi:hypothetical protein
MGAPYRFLRGHLGHFQARRRTPVRTKLIAVCAVLLALAPAAKAQSPELSVTSRLDERRYVASGSWAYVVGTEAGNFPAMGFHTRGEMGGVWSPLKLLDGVWFAVDGHWLNDATRFTSGYGYTRMDFPERSGLRISRTDFVPDGDRTVVMRLWLRSTGTARTVNLSVDAHSELMSAYPWPVVRQQLGVRPDMGRRRLEVVPQVPAGQHRAAGAAIRLGDGAVDVAARRGGGRYVTAVRARAGLRRLVIGHTLPRGSAVGRVRLDGESADYFVRTTNRGMEVLVRAPARGRHTLMVRAG